MSSRQELSDFFASFVRQQIEPGRSAVGHSTVASGRRREAGKVLSFFIQDLREGGAERNVVRILNGIVARGISADLVVISKQGSFFAELDDRVNVFELPQDRTASSVLGLRAYIDERRPAALISSLTHTNVAAILANWVATRPTRLVVVERNQFSLNRKTKRGLVSFSYRLVPWLYRRADVVACVSAGVRKDLARTIGLSEERTAVLYNPVVSDALETQAQLPLLHRWFASGQTTPVILGVGRLYPQKNFSLLIEAVAKVLERRPVRLILLGEGALRSELQGLVDGLGITEHVDLPGFDPNPFRFMKRSAVFVLSSDWEGLPTSLIEAMACGTPVVATDCDSGPREILEDGRFGRIVPKGDVKAMAREITNALDHPGDRAPVIARAREFSLESAVDGYLQAAGWR